MMGLTVENLVLSVVIASCIFVCVYDVELSTVSKKLYPRKRRYRRLSIWLPMGITYGLFYSTRYNIVAGNVAEIRQELNFTKSDFGTVFSSGFWTYAMSAPFTGVLSDKIGAKESMLVGAVGATASNLSLGYYFSHVIGVPSLMVFRLFYATNILFQGLGTAGIVKQNAKLYRQEERGVFSGVFNVLLTSGYYLALGICPSIVQNYGWPYVFWIPATGLCMCIIVLMISVPPTPRGKKRVKFSPEHQDQTDRTHLLRDISTISAVGEKGPIQRLFSNPTFGFYLLAIMASSWVRDGLLTWMYSFLATADEPMSSSDNALLGGAGKFDIFDACWCRFLFTHFVLFLFVVTFGGFVGGIVVGLVSDVCFHRQRLPPILLFNTAQLCCLVGFYMSKEQPVGLIAVFVFLICTFLLGNYTILSYTVPCDLPSDLVGTAAGVLTSAGYVASGFSGVLLGTTISKYGYFYGWYLTLIAGTLFGTTCVLVAYFLTLSREKREERLLQAMPIPTETTPMVPQPLRHAPMLSRVSSIIVFGGSEFVPIEEENVVYTAGIKDEYLRSRMGSPNFYQFEEPGTVAERMEWRMETLEPSEEQKRFFYHRRNDPTSYFGKKEKSVFPI